MTEINQNISNWVAGDDKEIVATIVDEAGAAVDTTGSTATYVIAEEPGGVAIISKTVGSGIAVGGGASNNEVTITIDDNDTITFSGQYYHELELIDTTGKVYTAFVGYITFLPDTA